MEYGVNTVKATPYLNICNDFFLETVASYI